MEYTETGLPLLRIRIEEAEEDTVKEVVDYAGKCSNHKRKRIDQHPAQQLAVKLEVQPDEVRNEEQGADDATEKNRENHITEIRSRADEMQQPHIGRRESGHIDSESGGPARTQRDEREEQEYVRASLDKNLQGLEYGELHGSVLLAKFGKKYCRDAVEGKYSTHIHHAAPVAVIAQKMRQRLCENDHQCEEAETHTAHHSQRT